MSTPRNRAAWPLFLLPPLALCAGLAWAQTPTGEPAAIELPMSEAQIARAHIELGSLADLGAAKDGEGDAQAARWCCRWTRRKSSACPPPARCRRS